MAELQGGEVQTAEDLLLSPELHDPQTSQLAEVHAAAQLLRDLEGRVGSRGIKLGVELRVGELRLVVVTGVAALHVDDHLGVVALVVELLDVRDAVEVADVEARAENDADLAARVDVGSGDERAHRVVEDGNDVQLDVQLLELLAQQLGGILADTAAGSESLGPVVQRAPAEGVLGGGEGECEAGLGASWGVGLLDGGSDEAVEVLGGAVHDLLGNDLLHLTFGGDGSVALEVELHDAQVAAAEVDGEGVADLIS